MKCQENSSRQSSSDPAMSTQQQDLPIQLSALHLSQLFELVLLSIKDLRQELNYFGGQGKLEMAVDLSPFALSTSLLRLLSFHTDPSSERLAKISIFSQQSDTKCYTNLTSLQCKLRFKIKGVVFVSSEPSKTLFVKGLSEETTEETLKESFDGSVRARIVTDRETGSSKG